MAGQIICLWIFIDLFLCILCDLPRLVFCLGPTLGILQSFVFELCYNLEYYCFYFFRIIYMITALPRVAIRCGCKNPPSPSLSLSSFSRSRNAINKIHERRPRIGCTLQRFPLNVIPSRTELCPLLPDVPLRTVHGHVVHDHVETYLYMYLMLYILFPPSHSSVP